MRIPVAKELTMKKAILKAIEDGDSPASLADGFGVSKSTIYKYRRALRDQGFIKKNENDIYIIVRNKFSKKPTDPETAHLDLTFEELKQTDTPEESKSRTDIESRIQDKLQQLREKQLHDEKNGNKGLLKRFLEKFKKF